MFVEKLLKETDGFHEIQIVFDRYIESSLKERTRERRMSGKAVHYIISDSTSIVGVPLKQLLSNLNTKQDLTIYFAKHIISVFRNLGKEFVVVYDTTCVSNITGYHDFCGGYCSPHNLLAPPILVPPPPPLAS